MLSFISSAILIIIVVVIAEKDRRKNLVRKKNVEVEKVQETKKVEKTFDKVKVKNTVILAIGAVLIIFSAITFLGSTWDTIPDIIKVLVLFIIMIVFAGLSYVAREKMDLQATANVFYYISLAYFPIMLYSIYFFELIGKYFGVTGDGAAITVCLINAITAAVYYFESARKNNNILKIIGTFFEQFAVMSFAAILELEYDATFLVLVVYNLLVEIVVRINSVKSENEINASSYARDTVTLGNVCFAIFYGNIGIRVASILITLITYGLKFYDNKNKVYRIVVYILSNVFLLLVLELVELQEYFKLVPVITSMAIIILERYFEEFRDNLNSIYMSIFLTGFLIYDLIDSSFSSFKSNFGIADGMLFILLVLLIMIIHLFKEDTKTKEYLIGVSTVSLIPSVYILKIFELNEYNFSYIIGLLIVILTTILSIKKGKINGYTISSAILLLIHMMNYNNILFVNIQIEGYVYSIAFIIWSIAHLCTQDSKLIKSILYISMFYLYGTLVTEIGLDEFTITKAGGLMVLLLMFTRKIFTGDESKVLETIGLVALNLMAISMYQDEIDGLIYVILLVFILMFSYYKKLGPLFLVSGAFILINVFILTREFWFTIPWWAYLLVLGIILIVFAMRNESKDKKINIAEKIKNIYKE